MNSKYRIKFTKVDKMCFIGHLDLQKLFQRAIKRAALPVAYSQGFNPHQLTGFAIPLPLGMSSKGEIIDVQLNEPMDCGEIKTRLNKAMPIGIEILNVRELIEGEQGCAAALRAAVYDMELPDIIEDFQFEEILKQPQWIIEKVGKKGTAKMTDIKPDVYNIEIVNDKTTHLKACIATGSNGNLKPDLLLSFLYNSVGKEFNPYKTEIMRLELLRETESGFQPL